MGRLLLERLCRQQRSGSRSCSRGLLRLAAWTEPGWGGTYGPHGLVWVNSSLLTPNDWACLPQNKKNTPERMELMKYNKYLRR